MEQMETYLPLILDGVLCLYLLIMGIIGAKKGFLKGLIGFVGLIVAVVVAYFFASEVATFAETQWGLATSMNDALKETFLKQTGMDYVLKEGDDLGTIVEAMNIGISPMILKFIFSDFIKIEGDIVGSTVAEVLADNIASWAIVALSGVVIFIVVAIVLSLVTSLFTFIFNQIALLGFVNSLLGFVLGLVKAILVVSVVLFALNAIPVDVVHNAIENSYVSKYLSEALQTVFEMVGVFTA